MKVDDESMTRFISTNVDIVYILKVQSALYILFLPLRQCGAQWRIQEGGLLGLQPPFGKWENMYYLRYECYV